MDGKRSVPSNSTTTPAACCSPAKTTDACLTSRSGMMSEPSTASRGVDWWMSSLEDSRVRTSPLEAQPKRALMENAAASGHTWLGLFAKWDAGKSSWKTPQRSLLEGLDVFSATWPRWGMMRAGGCSLLPKLAHDMSVQGCLSLPTVTASWATRGPGLSNNMDKMRMSERSTKQCLAIVSEIGWRWPASALEWMMGLPITWTGLRPLETGSIQRWCDSHGIHFQTQQQITKGKNEIGN